MGEQEDKEIQSAINLALVQQRVDGLEKWKCGYEEAQNQRWNNFEKKMDKYLESITTQIANMSSQLNEEKNNWFNRVPWFVTLIFSSMASLIVYFVTKK